MSRKIAVIGGGAAGMMAAIAAARAGARVTVYEKNDRVGKKILSTGNGKCNFSNERMDGSHYHGSGAELIDGIYHHFGAAQTRRFFEGLGMRIKSRDGYLYPASGQASTVLDVLRYEMDRLSINVHTGQRVTGVFVKRDTDPDRYPGGEPGASRLVVETGGRAKDEYDAVIITCGGKAAGGSGSDGDGYMLAERLGHRIIPVVPALTALRCSEDFYKRVSGVRCDANLTLCIDGRPAGSDRGELQWTDYGISGIPVFQLSRDAAYALREGRSVTVMIDLMPDGAAAGNKADPGAKSAPDRTALTEEAYWRDRWDRQGGQTMEQFVTGLVNKKLGLLLLKLAGLKETEKACNIAPNDKKNLTKLFRSLIVSVKGTNSFDQAQVCAGGVDCAEVTLKLESRIVPGVYFAGEVLDIDGACGGYNLQWAWSSGYTAGRAAAGSPAE